MTGLGHTIVGGSVQVWIGRHFCTLNKNAQALLETDEMFRKWVSGMTYTLIARLLLIVHKANSALFTRTVVSNQTYSRPLGLSLRPLRNWIVQSLPFTTTIFSDLQARYGALG
jgi:hypothetical protein